MSLEVQQTRHADDAPGAKTNLCICAPPFGSFVASKQPVQQGIDVEQQPWQEELCPPCVRPAGAPVRPAKLFNTKCLYFNQPGGCKRDDCRFLHDEEPEDVVFYNECPAPDASPDYHYYYAPCFTKDGCYMPMSRPPCVKVEDVRVFFGNIPQSEAEARVRELVEPLGEIVRIDIQPSKLHNRRCSGFIHMTNLAAAEAVVEKINATVIGRAKLYANIKSHKTLYKSLADWDPSLMYNEPVPVGDAALGVNCETAEGELQIGLLPPLLELDEEAVDAFEVSPISVVHVDLNAVPAFGLK